MLTLIELLKLLAKRFLRTMYFIHTKFKLQILPQLQTELFSVSSQLPFQCSATFSAANPISTTLRGTLIDYLCQLTSPTVCVCVCVPLPSRKLRLLGLKSIPRLQLFRTRMKNTPHAAGGCSRSISLKREKRPERTAHPETEIRPRFTKPVYPCRQHTRALRAKSAFIFIFGAIFGTRHYASAAR